MTCSGVRAGKAESLPSSSLVPKSWPRRRPPPRRRVTLVLLLLPLSGVLLLLWSAMLGVSPPLSPSLLISDLSLFFLLSEGHLALPLLRLPSLALVVTRFV